MKIMTEIIVFVLFLLIVYGLYIYYNERSKKIMPSTEPLYMTLPLDEDIYQEEEILSDKDIYLKREEVLFDKKVGSCLRKVAVIGLVWLGLACVGLGLLALGFYTFFNG